MMIACLDVHYLGDTARAAVIERISEPINVYIIDAYCYLSPEQEPGLGAYLLRAIEDYIHRDAPGRGRILHFSDVREVPYPGAS